MNTCNDPGFTQAQEMGVAAGCWLLAAGCWLLAAGCWLLATITRHSKPDYKPSIYKA